jgi:hypothetical protein
MGRLLIVRRKVRKVKLLTAFPKSTLGIVQLRFEVFAGGDVSFEILPTYDISIRWDGYSFCTKVFFFLSQTIP